MNAIDTDYLIVGSGAVGLAFADTLLAETDADIAIIDRHGKPGGHWNDAYSFVALHQPSAFYGVNSMPLGTGRKDSIGVNAGLYELASGPEVSGYFDAVMRQHLLPSGRVRYFPMADYKGDGRFVSLLSGVETGVSVRKKTVDATYYGTTVPATHKPKYAVSDGVRLITPNALADLWQSRAPAPPNYVILGAGKTAMDVGVWLLNSGAAPDAISWVMPRDSWLLNRQRIQPGLEFFEATIGAQAEQIRAFAQATSIDDLFDRLEAIGLMVRIDRSVRPRMIHYATISVGEIEQLRRIANVLRQGHVRALEGSGIVFDSERVAMPEGTLYIDCTASAVEKRPAVPIFQGNTIIPQLVRAPQPAFSAALTAYVEAHYGDDAEKNMICTTVPFPDTPEMFPATNIANMMNQYRWGQDTKLSRWIRESRLDGFGKVIAAVGAEDADKQAILAMFQQHAPAAIANLQRLAAEFGPPAP
ncbi:MAG: NAD(P)-binding protein [Sphingomonas sp.]